MDSNERANDESLDSVPHPTYETLQDEEMCGNINRTVETDDNYNMSGEEERKAEDYDSDHDTDKVRHIRILVSQNLANESNDQDIHEDISLGYEEEEELCEEYVQDGSESRVEHVTADSKTDALIVQGNDGMIKKIKICNTTKDDNEKSENKTKKLLSSSQVEGNNTKLLPRSSTPMSREYLALQRSVNESKILTEFVTDAASEKPRKLRAKDSTSSLTSSTADHSYSSTKKSSQSTPEKVNAEDIYCNISPNQVKRHYSKRYVPLKDSDYDIDLSSNLRPRSRSKSVHNNEFNTTGGSYKRLKRWPSEERLHKRTNMRSENSEFAQKQMEFLQRVIHACDLPQSRSRSRSCDRKTPTSLNDQSLVGSGVSSGQQRKNKSGSKERHSRRSKCEMGSENDEQLLGENNSEHPDDEYGNESQASIMNINTPADTSLADNKEVEAHLKSVWQPSPKPGYDSFCWKCHENKVNLCCCKCIRSFHAICVKISKFDNIWLCPECTTVENLLNNPKRLRRNELSLDLLSQLLSFALKRMRYTKGHYNFVMPYEDSTVYKKYVANPVTLSELQSKIEAKEFRCAEEFVNETKWMLHNAYILSNRISTKLVLTAKSIFKICRQEANEIETCAECYLNANTRTDWFVDVCSQPHLLLWAKLKGFPYWPAKAMGLGQNSLINVRFFGEHDRAFVPLKDCFLYSEQDPNTATGKRAARELADCIKEVEEHIGKIRSKVGGFKYAPFKTPYEPAEEMKQLAEMMPGVEDFIRKQQSTIIKPSLQFKIYKTADNNLSIVQKASTTPEISTSSLENDEKEKKKKLTGEGNESKKSDETTSLPAKYEVISKVNSDESNTSKLGTVILKRKSINGDTKKANDDENIELPLPKMTKIEDQSIDEDLTRFSAKRKLENQPIEKLKTKHSKLELKVPIITIKTSLAKEPTEIHNKESKIHSLIASKATENHSTKKLPVSQENEAPNASQKVVENLVKHKQGVTIKKITKGSPNSNYVEQITSTTSRESPKESWKDEKENQEHSADEKARENLKVNNILKGLVPFVEVKQELLTDNEEDTAKKMQNDKYPENETNSQTIDPNKDSLKKVGETPEANPQTVNNNDNGGSSNNTSENNSQKKPTEKEVETELAIRVKKEVLSDEDEINENINSSSTVNQAATKLSQCNTSSNSNNDEIQTANAIAGDIRVVGDTTIQKLPNTNNKTQYIVYSTNASNNNITGNIVSSGNNNSITAKRLALKGVPYGPLPASAFPKVSTSKAFHQADIGLQPRAKKSFPNLSPPNEKSRANHNQNTLTQMSPPTTSQHLDQKRAMAKNTMVTIPVEVAVNRSSTNSGTIIIGSIPVPPLTAVSKTMPSSLAHNSTARNSPATITVSGSSGSLTTPSVLAQTKTTQSTASIAAPITVTTSSTLLAPLTSASSLLSTPVSTTSTLNPLTMTTPPPLAGLSNSNLIPTPQTNGVTDQSITTAISSLPANQHPSTETHILGGLVTPTLASAITDVICRGPPKLSARPNGPLQSDGYPMFPSQAGPVCKRLVENVHKLTDFFISVVEDTMGEMAQGDDGNVQAKATLLTIELERNKLAYEQEIAELKRTSDLMLCEMRKSMENEKTRLAVEIRKQCEMERLRSVEETKRKQWCANCFREANFYCCWNTSYCDYPCQQLHWSRHSHTCAQTRPSVNETTNSATSSTQAERHHTNKTNSTITLSSSANFNKSTPISQKKEKGITKNSSNHMMSSSLTTSATPTASRPEVLKLPTNTYLRPVTSNLNSQTLRCNTTYSLPIQRFSSPMPITNPSNSSSPQTYTIVQQGNSWVMSSTNNNNSNNSNNNSVLNSSTIAPPIASTAGQTRSTGTGTVIANKSAKTQIRYH